jgi:glycine/D-amino acid oxidase-like deaminating enzyme
VPYARRPRPDRYAALQHARPVPYWLDSPQRPDPLPPLTGSESTDLLVVGAGFTGLWTAVLAKQEDPGRDVLVIEAGRVGWAATGRNGGFCAASITHGFGNGLARWPDELALLTRLGNENLAGIAATIREHDIDCSFETTGELSVATEPYQVAELQEMVGEAAAYGETLEWLDADALREAVDSPLFLGGVRDREGIAMVDPARLAWGLRRVALELGVRLHEGTRGVSLDDQGAGLAVGTESDAGPGSVTARRVALATNAFPPLLRRLRHYLVPVYDYAVMTEPLPDTTWKQLGWAGREGIGDSGNQFHYTRRTDDGRILYGGYDAVYHRGGMAPDHDQRPETFALLVEHLVETFPVLDGVAMSHMWGGAIDTCSRFSPFMGTARGGRVAYSAGYTGLGVGASRFGAAVMLDLLAGRTTERTDNEMVRTLPLPFPPEPLRWAGIEVTRWSLDRADRRDGRRNLWLRTLDRLGLGFDS